MFLQPYRRSPEQWTHWKESKPRGQVLLAEDDRAMREFLEEALQLRGYQVVSARSGVDLLALLEERLTDYERPAPRTVIVSDIRMARLDGLSVLEEIRSLGWTVPVILITAFGDEETRKRADALRAFALIDKPFEIPVLAKRIQEALSSS